MAARSRSPPFATYSHGVEVEASGWVLFGAGQVGVDTDGRIGDGIEEQARPVWRNIRAVLDAAGMSIDDIAQLTMCLVAREDHPVARAVRERRSAIIDELDG